MILQGKDGELRIYEYGDGSGNTNYLEVLFCNMDFSGPTSRPKTEETLIMNRGIFDSHAHYVTGNDEPRYASFPISFSCRLADTINSRILSDFLSGTSKITNTAGGSSTIHTWKGKTTIDGNTLNSFVLDEFRSIFRIEVLWDTDNSDLGYRYEEVYFTPGQQNISESADGLTLTCSGLVYGDVSRIASFWSGTSLTAFI